MADPNMADFYDRVNRFERMRGQGYGFEAQGALGRSFYNRQTKPRRNWIGSAFLALLVVFVVKAGIFNGVGAESYQARVDRLLAADGIDPVGGWLMQADPATLWLADRMAAGVERLK